VTRSCPSLAKKGAPRANKAQCESKIRYGKAPVSGSLPPKTCEIASQRPSTIDGATKTPIVARVYAAVLTRTSAET
jgi:hypothetical protein